MTEIRCDFDGAFPRDFEFRLGALCGHQRWTVKHWLVRKTRHGWHTIVTIREDISPLVTVAAQAILGSDWMRETYNLYRAQHLDEVPALWREARRWNALYSSHEHFSESVPDGKEV